jgi:hypothetical protein
MKKTSSVSSLQARLNQMALMPMAHSSALMRPARKPSSDDASRNKGITVSAPNSAFGNRSAASSLICRGALA